MTLTTLVTGASAAAREAAIAAALDPSLTTALILEGLPDGVALPTASEIDTIHIAAGCMCCTGNLTLRVTLNRVLRRSPARLYISLATTTHLEQIRRFLTQAPYDAWLTLSADIQI